MKTTLDSKSLVRLSVITTLASLLAATPARADESAAPAATIATAAPVAPALRGPTAWGILPWGGIGVGARFMFPLSLPSLLTGTNLKDSWALEAGADLLHWSYGYVGAADYGWTEVLPVVGMDWIIWLNPSFAVYPKVEAGYAFGWLSGYTGPAGTTPSYGGAFVNGAGGVMYKVASMTLRAEAGYSGLKVGAAWLF
jgi:hypothetical protein